VILASRSEYFRALLYGGLSEAHQSEIKLTSVPLEPFKLLLKYIYSGKISLTQLKEDKIFDLLGLANQYGFVELEAAISEYLLGILNINNVCAVLDAAKLYNLSNLNWILSYMDRNADEILKHESFKALSKESLCTLLERDSFFAPEIKIFQAVKEWCKSNSQGQYDVSFITIYI
jgi:BTB/POZ domain-containing protein 9